VLVFGIPKVTLSSFADYLASGIVFDVNRNGPQKTRWVTTFIPSKIDILGTLYSLTFQKSTR
jgi:hypothetical protein